MDFDDTPAEAAFRAEARAFVAEHGPDPDPVTGVWPPRRIDRERDERFVAASRAWQACRAEHGFAGISWPEAYGGRGLGPVFAAIFAEEEGSALLLSGLFSVGIGMVGPTIIAHGTEAQKQRLLAPMLRGEQVWCQLFSEPGAGSDLAALATRAVPDGDEWVVDGQKVWTSHAHDADWGILLARTNPDVPKHAGITCFLVDMRSPGIDVRPLRMASGSAEFNEVFLDGLRLPDSARLGPVDEGWRVAMTTLTSERVSIGGNAGVVSLEGLLELADRSDGRNDPAVRQELARFAIRRRILTLLSWRQRSAVSAGRPPGPESSLLKLAMSGHLEATGDLIEELLGADGMLDHADAPGGGTWQGHFLYQWASRIGGGTDQVQRTVVGERVLGLPSEPRADKGVAFRELRR